jgi:hypothetical protein
LTTRAGDARAAGKPAMLLIDDTVVALWPLSTAWTTVTAEYTTEHMSEYESSASTPDTHEAIIVWPDPGQDRATRAGLLARAFDDGPARAVSIADMSTVWGEIQTFQVGARLAARPRERSAGDRVTSVTPVVTCASS